MEGNVRRINPEPSMISPPTVTSSSTGHPATPRMMRSVSGTLKSNDHINSNSIEGNNYTSKSTVDPKREQLLPPPSMPKNKPPKQPQFTSQTQSQAQPSQFHRKSIGDWDFIKTIGAGSMGKVKLAQHNSTQEICAVKIIPRAAKLYQRAHANDPPPQSPQEAAQRHKEFDKEVARDKRTIREGALGRLLFHPYICRLYEMVPMTNHYYMLFEYIEGGQMLDYIVAHGSLKERHARKFARGIASALDYCHHNNVVHRDLKIENIMINEKGDIKIIDFGLSNLYTPSTLLKTYCGSLYFAAPELLSAKPYVGPEVDVWSFGVVLYVLVCGKVPFDDQSVSILHEKIKKGNVEYPNFLSKECISLLSRMLVVDPTKRATLYEICSHPWMNKGYDYKVSNYLPQRKPLSLPLDPEIIKTIAQFDLGNVKTVTEDLTALLTSVEYQMSCENWYKVVVNEGREYASANNSHILPDPTGGFHPLISIYYLIDEMKIRKKVKEEAMRKNIPKESVATQVSFSTPQPKLVETQSESSKSRTLDPSRGNSKPSTPQKVSSPVPEPISIPPQAHTADDKEETTTEEVSTPVINLPQQETDEKQGFNLMRKLSKKKDDRLSPDPMVRRGVSMKITAKEKQRAKPSSTSAAAQPPSQPISHQRTPSNKFQGFIPVEYLPPLPNIDANNQLVPKPPTTLTTPKMHPTARAKSVGGHVRKESYGRTRSNSQQLPNNMADQNSDEVDGFFDDIKLEDVDYQEVPQLTEEQIMDQYNNAKPNSMPSIEHCKTLFLKGFFSVQTTSSKPLPVIRYNIIHVLSRLGVKFQEVKGGFVCIHTRSVKDDLQEEHERDEESLSPHSPSTPQGHKSNNSISSTSSHRRKFSIGNNFLSPYRKKNGSQVMMPPNTPATARVISEYENDDYDDEEEEEQQHQLELDDSADSLGYVGGSDMLVSSRIEQRAKQHHRSASVQSSKNPLKFEIHIVKVPLVGLHGVQFKKLLGNTWNYKTLAGQILNEMNL